MGAEFILRPGFAFGGQPYIRSSQLHVDGCSYMVRVTESWRPLHQRELRVVGYVKDGTPYQFDHIPYEDEIFGWLLRHMADDITTLVIDLTDNRESSIDPHLLLTEDTATIVGPVWCPIANIVAERSYGPGGMELRRGAKHFPPGAKVYCYPPLWGDGYENIQVIGRHRGSHRYVKMVIRSAWLTNWRVDLAYSPHLIRHLWPMWSGIERSKTQSLEIVEDMRIRSQREAERLAQIKAQLLEKDQK